MNRNIGVVAIIPARGGSKSVKNKNIKLLNGKPLIAWTIETARAVKAINRVIVSTDHPSIAAAATKYGAEVMPRPETLSTDDSLPIDVIRYCIAELKNQGDHAQIMLYLEPTSPLRTATDIQNGLEQLTNEFMRYDSVASFTDASLNPHRAWKLNGCQPEPFIPGAIPWLPRQKLPKSYQLNGSFYGFWINSIKKDSISLLNGNIGSIIMPKERSIDIDDDLDFIVAELMMERKWKHENDS